MAVAAIAGGANFVSTIQWKLESVVAARHPAQTTNSIFYRVLLQQMKLHVALSIALCAPTFLGAAVVSPNTNLTAREEQIIAAAKNVSVLPQFHGAGMVGIRPNTPLVYGLPVTGLRPFSFSATKLPAGITLDPQTGILTGSFSKPGEYKFTVTAKNSAGKAKAEIKIICGDTLALTPPMGWNSYDAFGDAVREDEVLANAQWLKEHLGGVGWDTVVVDFRWYDSKADGLRVQNPEGVTLDEFGRCIPPTNRFPSAANSAGFKPLADKIHAMGLKFGIHIMRGIPRRAVQQDLPIHGTSFKASQAARPVDDTARECRWNRDMYGVDASTEAGNAWYADIAKQYADWGVDYIKCDDIANLERGTNRYPRLEVEALANGLRNSGRSILLSLSPGPALLAESEHLKQQANLWRISGDFWDNWPALNRNFDLFANWSSNTVAGHWPDGDMIPFGHICLRNCDVRPERWTRFTRDEQLTLMSLWVLAPSPLMLGMNLPDNDDWTTALLTNPEVLAIDQDALKHTARKLADVAPGADVRTRELADGSTVVGFFNRTANPVSINISWKQLGFASRPKVRDLWLRSDLKRDTTFSENIAPHSCILVRVK
jgi:alpha-galactosidase